MQVLLAETMLNSRILNRVGQPIKSLDLKRKHLIGFMQAQIKQTLILSIKLLEMDIFRIPKKLQFKIKKIRNRRNALRKELDYHKVKCKGEGRRIMKYTTQHA